MITVSDGLNHVLWPKNILKDQGYNAAGQSVSHQTVPDWEVFVVIAY